MAVAQNTVIIDDVEYKPGEQLPELGSIHRVFKDGGKRHYEGLAKDSDKLPLYVANNSSCFMTDTGEYYKFDESKKLWYKPDKIEQSKVTPIEVYGVLNGKIHQVSEDVEGIATPLLYKGSVSDISQLPLSPKIGWMYNISEKSIYGEAGMNVAWTGEIWDALGPAIDMAPYLREDSEIITSLKTKTENLESANYTDRGTLADTDAFLINDGVGMKKSVLSKLSDFVLNKIADKVFAKLQTNDKTILGAINELNSKNSNLVLKTDVFDIQALVSKASPGTCILFHLSGANYTGNDLPIDSKYKYGSGIIFYRNSNSCKIVLFPEEMKPVWKMANWTKWRDFANSIVD